MPHETISYSDFKRIAKAPTAGKYLFFGDEDYLKKYCADTVLDAICPDFSMRTFNCLKIDRATFSPQALQNALIPPPMFTACKAVVATVTFDDLKQSDIDGLCTLLESEDLFDFNFLIIYVPSNGIDAGTPKRPSAIFKRLSELLIPVRFDRVSGARLREWLTRRFISRKLEISPENCDLMTAYCGDSMYTLASEAEKLSFYLLSEGRQIVTAEDIKLISSEGGEHDAFALSNAILNRRCAEALDVLSEMKARRVEPVAVMGELIRVICDMTAVFECLAAGYSPARICAETGMREYPVKLYTQALSGLSKDVLAATLNAAVIADEAIKSSSQNYLPIERLICSL